ncbi:multiheme c-type cytochrome [Nitrosophilus kaiyonis]|uniref:multiheme c-type cytochrome n=1 Tax=Nitrosophilus kaiyonis TaxID=2930200 RepID=UPI0024936142|nr:multiheme c-type cytochrome [Nitrosophilus kaiyonis]
MKKITIFFMILKLTLFANIFAGSATKKSMEIKGEFAKSKQCIRCHLDIYEEYKSSSHFNSSIYRDKIHKKVFELHSKATNEKNYICAKCHTPLVKNKKIENMDENKTEYKEAIACAYCHRIKSIQKHKKANKNIILNKKGVYYGTRNPEIRSEYHKIINTNIIHKNGDTCMGCHSHKQNSFGFVVCKTENKNTLKENCITCHMPQVEGSLSDRVETPTHAYHGFAALTNRPELLKKYINLKIEPKKNFFIIEVENLAPHSIPLHPIRMFELIVEVYKNGKLYKVYKRDFHKVLGKGKKAAPPWIADRVLKDTTIKPKEKKIIKIDIDPKNKKIVAKFGFFIVNPKAAKKMNLEEFSKFRLLKKIVFKNN